MILQYILLFYVHESLMYTHTHEGTQPKKKKQQTRIICSELPSSH